MQGCESAKSIYVLTSDYASQYFHFRESCYIACIMSQRLTNLPPILVCCYVMATCFCTYSCSLLTLQLMDSEDVRNGSVRTWLNQKKQGQAHGSTGLSAEQRNQK